MRLISRRGAPKFSSRLQVQTGRLKVVQALGLMNIVQSLDGLEFDKHQVFHQQISRVLTNTDAIVQDNDASLLHDAEAPLANLMRQRVVVHLLEETRSQYIGNSEGTADHQIGDLINPCFICVHLRSFAVPIPVAKLTTKHYRNVDSRTLQDNIVDTHKGNAPPNPQRSSSKNVRGKA